MNAHFRQRGLVAVSANADSPTRVLAEMHDAFVAFRERNAGKISEIERNLDEVNSSIAALKVGGGGGSSSIESDKPEARTELSAIGLFAKNGSDAGIKAMARPVAGMSSDSDPDGGYLVTPTISKQIQRKVFDVSPLGRLARRVTITRGDSFEEPIDPSDIGAEWVGEREERPSLTTSSLRYLSVPLHEIYTSQPITQRLLDDSEFNLGQWLEGKISDKFARTEGKGYVTGDGINKPRGLLTYSTSTDKDGVRPWGTIQHIITGVDGGFAVASTSVNGGDALFNVVYSLRAPYRPNARWLMNLSTAGVVRKLKDAEGRFVWVDAREG